MKRAAQVGISMTLSLLLLSAVAFGQSPGGPQPPRRCRSITGLFYGQAHYAGYPIQILVPTNLPLNQYYEGDMQSAPHKGQYYTRFGGVLRRDCAGGQKGLFHVTTLSEGEQTVKVDMLIEISPTRHSPRPRM